MSKVINRFEGDWPISEGSNTPKLMIGVSQNDNQHGDFREIKQLGINYVLIGGPPLPWREKELNHIVNIFKNNDLSVGRLWLGGYKDVVLGRDGANQQIEHVQQSLRAAGAVGIPVVEYNWIVDRLTEGYYYVKGRGGAGYTGYNYSEAKDLLPNPDIGIHSTRELWDRLTYFLKAVIPVAEEACVRMAIHPNDPPASQSHGSDQIMTTFNDFKRLLNIVDSPFNGMTCHPGYYEEIGEDTLKVIRYLGKRDRINHVHYRNIIVKESTDKYIEGFPDYGQVNMFAAMRELVRQDYTGGIYPEHTRALDYDRNHPDGISHRFANVGRGGYAGKAYNIAYARAMLQASLIAERNI